MTSLKLTHQFVFIVGVLFLQVIFAQPANALSFKIDNPFKGVQFNKEKTLKKELEYKSKKTKELNSKIEQKVEIVQSHKNETIALAEDLKKTEEEIKVIEAKVEQRKAELASKTVTIKGYASDAAGNRYAGGNCTWYVKSKRPDIGNFWGNANNWINSAKAGGFDIGNKPKIGAIGVTQSGYYGHVVYVEDVNGDSIKISEMNAVGLGVVSSRNASASEFSYIYAMR